MSLYKPLIILVLAAIVSSSLVPIRAAFSSGLRDSTRRLIKVDSFYLVSLVYR